MKKILIILIIVAALALLFSKRNEVMTLIRLGRAPRNSNQLAPGQPGGNVNKPPDDTNEPIPLKPDDGGPKTAVGGAEWGFFSIPTVGNPLSELSHVRWSRLTALVWSRLQNVDGSYKWEEIDGDVRQSQTANYNLVFVIKTGNNKSFSDPSCYQTVVAGSAFEKNLISCPLKPEFEGRWKQHITNIVERYDGDGKDDMPGLKSGFTADIQIENEAASSNYWYPNQADGKLAAASYINLLKLSYEAKQQANPGTRIILPGIIDPNQLARCTADMSSMSSCANPYQKRNRDFTTEILKQPKYFDAVDVHFFDYFKFDPDYIKDGMTWVKSEMSRNGYQKPVYSLEWTGAIMMLVQSEGYVNEFAAYFPYTKELGSVAAASDVYKNLNKPENKKYREWFEAEQAREFPKMFTTMLANGVERLVHVQTRDYFGSGWDNIWWNWQGIVRYEGTVTSPRLIKKPSYYTYKMLEQKLYGFNKVETLRLGGGIFAYKFSFESKSPVIVAWIEGAATTVNLSLVLASDQARVTPIITDSDKTERDATVETFVAGVVPITDTPVFIEATK